MSSLEFRFTKVLYCDASRKFHVAVCFKKKKKKKRRGILKWRQKLINTIFKGFSTIYTQITIVLVILLKYILSINQLDAFDTIKSVTLNSPLLRIPIIKKYIYIKSDFLLKPWKKPKPYTFLPFLVYYRKIQMFTL